MVSDYELEMGKDEEARYLCSQKVDKSGLKKAIEVVKKGYVAEWIVDNLPGERAGCIVGVKGADDIDAIVGKDETACGCLALIGEIDGDRAHAGRQHRGHEAGAVALDEAIDVQGFAGGHRGADDGALELIDSLRLKRPRDRPGRDLVARPGLPAYVGIGEHRSEVEVARRDQDGL